ncbi:MAG: PD-(D/E)XK nuclease-like domain-containing protein [Patescibacteria group bacterium]|nr:PD-(D/E)XK nuclease-like domain-containing protein [Patescibacteria group bacterium]
MIIDRPGIYDLPSGTYHSDPTITPSLSAGMITDLLRAPAICYANSSRLNPNWEPPEREDKFTLGTVRHVLFLEPALFDKKVAVIKFDDWRTKEAKTLRDLAREADKTPILEKHMDKVLAAREALLANELASGMFRHGMFEQSIFWQHPVFRFWCRIRPDFLASNGAHVVDYKATTDANPEAFGRHAYNLGYHRRAAFYLEGVRQALGFSPQAYWFVNQETKPPYLTTVISLDTNAIEAGAAQNERAAMMFDRCLKTGEWPGYRHRDALDQDKPFQVGLPTYAYMAMEIQEGD